MIQSRCMYDRLLGMQFAVLYMIYSQFISCLWWLFWRSHFTLKVSSQWRNTCLSWSGNGTTIELSFSRSLRRLLQALRDWIQYHWHLLSVFCWWFLFRTLDQLINQIGTKLQLDVYWRWKAGRGRLCPLGVCTHYLHSVLQTHTQTQWGIYEYSLFPDEVLLIPGEKKTST